jgi:hypothetical protein
MTEPLIQAHTAESFASSGVVAPDVYFDPAYGAAEVANGEGDWMSLTAFDGAWQLPLHLRTSASGTDASSPYGYAGVFADACLSQSDVRAAWNAAVVELRAREVLAVFLRQTPLLPEPFASWPGQRIVSGHPTVLVPTSDLDAAWSSLEGRCRTSLRRAEREGLSSTVCQVGEGDLRPASAFRDLYEAAMERRSASSRYFFSDEYYERLRVGLGKNLLVAMTTNTESQVVAAALFMRSGATLHYHLSGSDPTAGKYGATNQLIWAAMAWAAGQGVDRIHLGGGLGADDGLFRFKKSFGGSLMSYSAHGVVIDPHRYELAVRRRANELGRDESELAQCYFPAYKAL